MNTAALLKELREFAGISQQKLADLTGISQSSIARWELGQCEPTASGISKLADFFDISADEILCRNSIASYFNSEKTSKTIIFDDARVERPEILELYESLTPELQEHALAYLHGLADRAAIRNVHSVNVTFEDNRRKRQ